LRLDRVSGEISHPGNLGPYDPVMAEAPVRCLVAQAGPVPDDRTAPGNVAVVACAY